MKVIGLVGGSGSGKSAIASHLVERGAGHIDADRIAHEVLRENQDVVRAVRERFGDGVFTGDTVDRKKLGKIVFEDPDALGALNRIVHPAVLDACRKRLEEFETAGARFVVVDAALLLGVGLPFDLDLVIALRVSREERARRLEKKGGATPAEIRARLDSQSDLEGSFNKADVIVDATGSLSLVLAEIDRIVDGLLPPGVENE
jgi:dephospho-CoA kinase